MLRRILCLCLSALILLPLLSAPRTAALAAGGDVSAARAARLLRAASGISTLSAEDDAAKDVNGDGTFSERDGIAVLQLLLFSSPAEFVPSEPVAFVPSREVPLPEGSIAYGERFNLHGTVYSASALSSVTVTVTRDRGGTRYPFEATVTFSEADDIRQYALESAHGTREGKSITELLDFSDLLKGAHTLTVSAKCADYPDGVTLTSASFSVDETVPLVLTQNKFRENYSTALQFFGYDTSKFLFTFRWSSGRNISVNSLWRDTNIVKTKWGRVHVAAVPYFDIATRYLDSTYVRVTGNGHDSGIIRLSKLLQTISGPYVPRFVSERTYISHHTFGTAVDINHKLSPNMNSTANWALIRSEAGEHLQYNGIAADGERLYYDFTYTGSAKSYQEGVPTSLMNYLLYELAFFRAGFRWGYYYSHTCDGMHFTLTDSSLAAHSNLDTGLRKVFTYYN